MIRSLIAFATYVLLCLPVNAAVEVQEITTPGGINVWLVEEHTIPFTALEIRFRGGASLDRADKRGETNLMMALIEEGAADMDARGFARAQEALAASYRFEAYGDSVSISAKFLTENRDEAVDLLRTAITETRFDQDAIDRVRGQVLSIIRSDATDPGEIASRTFDKLAFGDHPYGSSRNGTEQSVQGLTRDDMFVARDRAMARDRLYVSAVGDINADELSALLDTLFAGLPETGAPMPERAPYLLDGGTTVIDFDTPQSVVLFGQPGIKRDDPDYVTAYLVNEIFGGNRESRLMDEVREKRGLTYGIGAYLVPMDHAEMIYAQFSSGNATVAEGIDVVRDEWRKISEEGITATELEDAKTYLTGAYALRFDGNAQIAGIMVGMQMVGLGPDYLSNRNDLVDAITLDEANRVAAQIYDPDALHVVVVGKPEGLE